jgi:hypothetical protein
MPPTTLLALMLATYAIPIAFVYYKYSAAAATATRSISSIITSKEPFITITDNNAPPPPTYSRCSKPGTSSQRVCS